MFKTSLSKEYEKIVKERESKLLEKIIKNKKKRIIKHKDLLILVYPGIFPPWGDSFTLAGVLEKIRGAGDVLDLGTGSGIQALAIAKNAKKIVATDINDIALESVRESIKLNNFDNIEVRKSNLFEKIPEKFDIIIFNPPFTYFKPKNILTASIQDEDYQTLTRFFKEVSNHLKSNGKIYMIFSDLGDKSYFEKLIKENGFTFEIIRTVNAKNLGEPIQFHYYIYKITK